MIPCPAVARDRGNRRKPRPCPRWDFCGSTARNKTEKKVQRTAASRLCGTRRDRISLPPGARMARPASIVAQAAQKRRAPRRGRARRSGRLLGFKAPPPVPAAAQASPSPSREKGPEGVRTTRRGGGDSRRRFRARSATEADPHRGGGANRALTRRRDATLATG